MALATSLLLAMMSGCASAAEPQRELGDPALVRAPAPAPRLSIRVTPSPGYGEWSLHSVGGLELASGVLDGPLAHELELPGPDLYLLELRGTDERVELPIWIAAGEHELVGDLRGQPSWSGTAIDRDWLEAWAISDAWLREVVPTHKSAGEPGLIALAERSRAEIADHRPELRLLLRFRWLHLFTTLIPDPGSVLELAEQAEPDAPVWTALGMMLPSACRHELELAEVIGLLERLADQHPSASLRAIAHFTLLAEAARIGNAEQVAARWAALDTLAYRGTEPHQWASRDYDPNHPLAPGQTVELRVADLREPDRIHTIGGRARERPTLLILWSISCHYCMEELPAWQQVHARHGDRLDIVSINVDGDAAVVEAFVAEQPMPWTHGSMTHAELEQLRERWRFSGVPLLVLVDERGVVQLSGKRLRAPRLLDTLAELLG